MAVIEFPAAAGAAGVEYYIGGKHREFRCMDIPVLVFRRAFAGLAIGLHLLTVQDDRI